jgi:hypothetical protein
VDVLAKLLIIASVIMLLKSNSRFQTLSRELDETALLALKRMMRVSEDYGYPPAFVPVLTLLTALSFMLSMYITTLYGR